MVTITKLDFVAMLIWAAVLGGLISLGVYQMIGGC